MKKPDFGGARLLFPSKNCLFRQFFENFASNISQISQNVTDNIEILRQFL